MIKWIRYHHLIAACVLISTVIGSLSPLNAAPGQWTWMWGDKDKGMDYSTVYGTEGIPSPDNYPLRRDLTSRWTEPNGDMWMYGGRYFDTGSYNAGDPRKYDAGLNQWAFYRGSKSGSYEGNYGDKGVASDNNLYGNDLWKYDRFNKKWNLIDKRNNSNSSYLYNVSYGYVYGTIKVEDAANNPGGRYRSTAWVGNDGMLWFFGGYAYTKFGLLQSYANELWRFNPQTNNWTYMGGQDTDQTSEFRYGTLGIESETNQPPVRMDALSWTDNDGNLWLYGGNGFKHHFSDLWKYNVTSLKWTWMGGTQAVYAPPTEPWVGVDQTHNNPGSRMSGASWVGKDGKFYLFGGYKYIDKLIGGEMTNEIWKLDPLTLQWTLEKGESTVSKYGNYTDYGIPSSTAYPPSRIANSFAVNPSSGNVFIYSGQSSDYGKLGTRNDLWRYEIPDEPQSSVENWQLF